MRARTENYIFFCLKVRTEMSPTYILSNDNIETKKKHFKSLEKLRGSMQRTDTQVYVCHSDKCFT